MALLDDDMEPRKPDKGPRKLDTLSIAELLDYVESLKAEIGRVEAEIDRKKARLAAAESIFKS